MLSVGRHAKVTVYGKGEGREMRFRAGAKNSKERVFSWRDGTRLSRKGLEAGIWVGETGDRRQSRVLMARPPCSQLSTSHLPLRLRRPEKRQPLVPDLNVILGTCSLLALDSLHKAC